VPDKKNIVKNNWRTKKTANTLNVYFVL